MTVTDPTSLVALASAGTAGIGILTAAALKGWEGWLDLRRLEARGPARPRRGARPDLAELRQRVRRLEAIADGTSR